MKFYKIFLVSVVIAFAFLNGCKNDKSKNLYYQYYKSGKLKRISYVINDSIPIDTTINYYENGNIKSIDVRDDSGILNGSSKIFYENGQLRQIIPYINGKTQGFVWYFSDSGKLEIKEYYFNNLQVGDIYYYDSLGKINGYRFKDFKGKSLLQIDYDNKQRIIKENRQALFIDSFILQSPKENEPKIGKICKILLIIANPPRCQNLITISFWGGDRIYKQFDIGKGHCYTKIEEISNHTDSIIVFSKQYDSISVNNIFEKSITPVLSPQ